ncbi:MAG: 50S ribosomal protein L4 [Acidimicrobiia bacterium]|nr:50S ribosomal protein L4 [Acidimicrobiia bacterium]
MANTPKARVYDSSGRQTGEMTLDAAVFGIEPNVSVMHQVVTARLAAQRSGTSSTKTRGEVSGGGKKPWKQKGLGRARQGSIRSPQWKGGGVVFGPKPRSYAQRTPRKMRRLALASALSARAAEGEVRVVDSFSWEKPHTRSAVDMLKGMGVTGKVLFVLGRADRIAERSVGNLPSAIVLPVDQLNAYDVLWAETIVFTSATVAGVGAGKFAVAADDFVIEDEASTSEGGAA